MCSNLSLWAVIFCYRTRITSESKVHYVCDTSRILFKLLIIVIMIRLDYSFALKLYTTDVHISGIMIVSMYVLLFSYFHTSSFEFVMLFSFDSLAGENDDEKPKDQKFLLPEELVFVLPLYVLYFP
jgi:hypothetical protein